MISFAIEFELYFNSRYIFERHSCFAGAKLDSMCSEVARTAVFGYPER